MPETNSLHERLMRILNEYQEIDVTAAKWLLFYPQLITLVMLAAGMILPVTAGRVRARMSKSAQLRIIEGLRIALDTAGLIFSVYFCGVWTYLILRQQPMRVLFTEIYAVLSLMTFAELTAFAVMVSKDEKTNKKRKNTGNGDR